jgi:hypothetical protein
MNSLARVMKADITVPDFNSISKHGIILPRHILIKAMEPGILVIVDSTGFRVRGKANGTRKNTMFLPGAPGARSGILRSMKIIEFWCANSLRRKWAIPQPFQICSTQLPPLSILSWMMAPTMANRLLKLF